MFKLGLIVNPFSGIGGSVALKGSDGEDIRAKALAMGAEPKSPKRAQIALQMLRDCEGQFEIFTFSGPMGEESVKAAGLQANLVGSIKQPSSAEDTKKAVKQLQDIGVDLIVFAGGDGTARDVYSAASDGQLVLGIPAGVKIHSGVYAITPQAAGLIMRDMIDGKLLSVIEADVMDIDEQAFRQGVVKARRYGELTIPAELHYVQAVKDGGRESEVLVLADIAAEIVERMQDEYWVIGSGTTCAAIMEELGLDNTLLGIDVVKEGELICKDATEKDLLDLLDRGAELRVVVTVIGGQGHILGRGNHQLSAEVIRRVGWDNVLVVATKSKLNALAGRPLLVDTGDVELDRSLSGQKKVITGYHDYVTYRVGWQ